MSINELILELQKINTLFGGNPDVVINDFENNKVVDVSVLREGPHFWVSINTKEK